MINEECKSQSQHQPWRIPTASGYISLCLFGVGNDQSYHHYPTQDLRGFDVLPHAAQLGEAAWHSHDGPTPLIRAGSFKSARRDVEGRTPRRDGARCSNLQKFTMTLWKKTLEDIFRDNTLCSVLICSVFSLKENDILQCQPALWKCNLSVGMASAMFRSQTLSCCMVFAACWT